MQVLAHNNKRYTRISNNSVHQQTKLMKCDVEISNKIYNNVIIVSMVKKRRLILGICNCHFFYLFRE